MLTPADRDRSTQLAKGRAVTSHDGMIACRQEGDRCRSWPGREFKVVGKSGQISLGKSYAGKTLRVERQQDGSIVLTAVAMVPERQLWTVEEPDRSRIAKGLEWSAKTPARESDVEALIKRRPKAVRASRGRRR